MVRGQLERLRVAVADQSFAVEERLALAELGHRIEDNLRGVMA